MAAKKKSTKKVKAEEVKEEKDLAVPHESVPEEVVKTLTDEDLSKEPKKGDVVVPKKFKVKKGYAYYKYDHPSTRILATIPAGEEVEISDPITDKDCAGQFRKLEMPVELSDLLAEALRRN